MVETNKSELGGMNIASEVLGIVAGIAATEVDGVAAMSGGLVRGIAEMLGRKNLSKGVKLEETDEGVIVELNLIVEFEVNIPKVTEEVQRNVKKSLEKMTGVDVKAVNINVLGIDIPEFVSEDESVMEEDEEDIGDINDTEEKADSEEDKD
ncbi:Asp23/Gls24 family envelope stress response protein [Halanaerobiaceae bacterium Z-7014]|uniref:Asp23/Gls24 family envelope stress response protein n=1 Tax=Halonatronomonas betaini TaxID=2778430 RepID=A0A931F7Y0_9FIRM|nr:Asp23/Gls24 family envelope stress response protein [Halonatronomonas betaini]MBF8437156.1 Asp23/Gls24 family envelope stress response protein [Halonatronomonas betaini]